MLNIINYMCYAHNLYIAEVSWLIEDQNFTLAFALRYKTNKCILGGLGIESRKVESMFILNFKSFRTCSYYNLQLLHKDGKLEPNPHNHG